MTGLPNSNSAIELVNLTKKFSKETAVNCLSLRIPKGTAFGFIGPNGAGKSTTIKMIMGLLRITDGQANILGIDVNHKPDLVKQRVGYVPEQQFIYRWMKVREVIHFCRSLYKTWNGELCNDLLDLFELNRDKKVKHLSKGMAAKLSLLLALSHEPELLILDEPTTGLDPIIREEFLDGILRSISEREQTVLLSSHTLADVQRLADTVGLIYTGQLLVHCPVDQLLNKTKRIRAILEDGRLPDNIPEGTVWQQIRRREWLLTVDNCTPELVTRVRSSNPVSNIEVMNLTLEDIFKDYVKGRRASA
ncbi:MAG: ABC transporter ATP-binding protein [Planctomycetota bacterium]|jgi:ABC-2 type transport system ATP-binding protein